MKPSHLSLSTALVAIATFSGCRAPIATPDTKGKAAETAAPAMAPAAVKPAESVQPAVAPKAEAATPASPNLLAFESQWKFTVATDGYEGDWKGVSFDDSSWKSGKAPVGYGDKDLGTSLDVAGGKPVSIRARGTFNVANPAAYGALRIRLMRDDGIVVYLNGAEIVRDNLPKGELKAGTLAPKSITGAAESEYLDLPIAAGKLVAGRNVIALSVHQNRPTSTDLWFDVELTGEVK